MLDFPSFKKVFKGDIVTPLDPEYPAAIARWAINSEHLAQIVAFVRDAADVVIAIKYARDHKLPLAIKCGGHNAGGASSSEGLVIDLSRHINSVRIDARNKLAYVGGGSLWEAVDKAAIKHGLAAVAGTVNHTGVGGLALGGGFGWLSGAHGLAIDNLVQATVVTANGSILNASETENTDLFFGIRGGGSNFGVCTEFVFRLHRQHPRVFAGMLLFAPDALDRGLVEVTDNWWTSGPGEDEGIIQLFTRGPQGKPFIAAFLFYNGTAEAGRAKYKAFFDLQPIVDRTSEIPYEELNAMMNSFSRRGYCACMKGIQHTGSVLNGVRESLERAVQLSVGEFRISLVQEYFSLKKINSVPNGKTAFVRRKYGNLGITAIWTNDTPENTVYGRNCVHEMTKVLLVGQAEEGWNDKRGYGNWDSDSDKNTVVSGDGARSLFGENYARLQEVKGKYDPEAVFSKWFVIRPVSPVAVKALL